MATLFYEDLTGMLESAATLVLNSISELNILDTKIGDGDHGTTMLKVMSSLINTIESDSSKDPEKLLDDIGWNVMSQDGGSAGMLMGTFFSGMAVGFEGGKPLTKELSAMLSKGASTLEKNSGAKPGDKTMLDAMLPAVATFTEAVSGGADTVHAFRLAADAAHLGVDMTRDMFPARGRAKNLGEKAVGVCDPGATSMALIFQGFYDFWKSKGE